MSQPLELAALSKAIMKLTEGLARYQTANRTAKKFSDLDLAILGDQPLTLSTLAELADDFSESDLPFKVDIVDWANTAERFRRMIESERVILQQSSKR